jgi:hypothetical protein
MGDVYACFADLVAYRTTATENRIALDLEETNLA